MKNYLAVYSETTVKAVPIRASGSEMAIKLAKKLMPGLYADGTFDESEEVNVSVVEYNGTQE